MVTTLDAQAVVAYLEMGNGWQTIRDLFAELASDHRQALMTAVSIGELYYAVERLHGPVALPELGRVLAKLPIEPVPADVPLAKEAAAFKATRKMSYADCFAAALAKLRGGRVVTGDPEFRAVEPEIPILWLPSAQGTPGTTGTTAT